MKRHAAFLSLSREHHDGLLLATRLRQGRKALERLWSHDPVWQARFVVEFFDEKLAEHFRLEENILFPEVLGLLKNDENIVALLLEEHAELRELAEALRHPEEKKLECTLTQFGEILERHIRREERELFPFCEANLTDEALEAIGRSMDASGKRRSV